MLEVLRSYKNVVCSLRWYLFDQKYIYCKL